ncbi:adenylate/guanylate cyclase domain-containing protein [Nocardia sp. BMG111209]|uniref:adenylate/guanylate cyclase domain-containing protein n=1 Tax=Nocardia sp. BMG111209 TaxID=1160137 RepID=UPI0003753338|nr:adenylate/guanylate cyclase domain-containing protein [Nocardia sp. BMG111209]
MRDPVDRAVHAIARRNSYALVWAQFVVAHIVFLGGLYVLRLYVPMSTANFWLLLAVSQVAVAIENAISTGFTLRLWAPVRAWQHGARDPDSTVAAWLALATFPLEYVRWARRYPVACLYLPFIGFIVWRLRLSWESAVIIVVVGSVALVYSLVLRFFLMEVVARPVLERIAEGLPADFTSNAAGLPLRWRLLAAAPAINVITGVVVAGLSSPRDQTLKQLGISSLIAVTVSFTISLELVVLVMRPLTSSLLDLQHAIDRVRAGDFETKVPIVSTDETGELAQAFNRMVGGLDERERLRRAFGAYVDPGLAERVLREGADLGGVEIEVSILFLDIRNFTAYAEQAEPHEVVALLNGFWELVVPILLRNGGHANKFIGDGLLGVFGAPDHLADHADHAVTAAMEIVATVREQYQDRIAVGVGVNSGRVVAGTVGGGGHIEFTVIGDTVNTAARVEAATRRTGDDVLITEATRSRLRTVELDLVERPPVPLKGKTETVRLWTPHTS